MRYWRKDIGTKVPYLSVIGALMYLANCTRSDIAFAVNILVRQCKSNSPSLDGSEAYPQIS